jgi:probable rRNA maturation factor
MNNLAIKSRLSGSLLVIFVNDRQISELNYRFKRRLASTDVLAFDLAFKPKAKYVEGEIYVNLQAAQRQASEYRVSYEEETARLCVHGMLHLIGYDDHHPSDRKKMWQIQEKCVKGKFNGFKRQR